MAYTYDQFRADCRETLLADPGVEGRKKVISLLERLLGSEDFVAEHFPADAAAGRPVIFQDPDTDFCVWVPKIRVA